MKNKKKLSVLLITGASKGISAIAFEFNVLVF